MVELSETFVLECEELDKDHRRLVEMVNEISATVDDGHYQDCAKQVAEFVAFTKDHFRREERLLTRAGYPDVGKHGRHHARLDEKMDHIVEFAAQAETNEMARESLKKELIYFVMDDVITSDMDFKTFMANKQG